MKTPREPKVTKDQVNNLLESVWKLTENRVLVGVPESTAAREDGPMTNAALAYIHDQGCTPANIPQREFMLPGIQRARPQIAKHMETAAQLALAGEHQKVFNHLYNAGLAAQNGVRMKITEGPFEPLAYSTIAARARRGRKGAQKAMKQMREGREPDAGLVKPLMDTGAMRQSITFVIRKKGETV